jgi:hypothetical protein
LPGNIEEELYMVQPEGLSILRMLVNYASFNGPSIDLSKYLGARIFTLMR